MTLLGRKEKVAEWSGQRVLQKGSRGMFGDQTDVMPREKEWNDMRLGGRVSWNHICEGSKNYDLELKAL